MTDSSSLASFKLRYDSVQQFILFTDRVIDLLLHHTAQGQELVDIGLIAPN